VRFEVFTAVKIQVVVFWVVTPYFRGPCCLHLQGGIKGIDIDNTGILL